MHKIFLGLLLSVLVIFSLPIPEVFAVCSYCPAESVDRGADCLADNGKPTERVLPKTQGCLAPKITNVTDPNNAACTCINPCPAGTALKCPGRVDPDLSDGMCSISSGARQPPTCLPTAPVVGVPGLAPPAVPLAPPCAGPNCTTATGSPCDPEAKTSTTTGPGIMTAIGCVPSEPKALVEGLLRYGTLAAGAIAFLLMILGALQMITAEGNPESIKHAQERFYSAIIGLLLIIFSVLLMQVIGVDILDLPGFER
jgi:hypothetical protein